LTTQVIGGNPILTIALLLNYILLGEQGVLICEPYKSEIGPNWRFKTKEIAKISADKIYDQFLHYLKIGEFVGADIARKYLQMGYTRARRYANYKGGKKYDADHDYANGRIGL
jgi:hypothetical protein